MIFALASQFLYLPCLKCESASGCFQPWEVLVEAFSMIVISLLTFVWSSINQASAAAFGRNRVSLYYEVFKLTNKIA